MGSDLRRYDVCHRKYNDCPMPYVDVIMRTTCIYSAAR